ncbi:GNAT family N-acetyltransferase [Chitinophaga sp. SYP-B3965]|uniref:GNAT family N-acetyltransferase n=1 Tax=Chitinophaga sp. SYP-B3965 TaxID=2663120 RepID=UPI001299E379|nr:GNAT family N-acetyltransferase [Chitinophaga sp. SYP-B3965]MRG45814.1 GNAT family N-acetyltransferase [Chitinophaga sp. SYP-B3965]
MKNTINAILRFLNSLSRPSKARNMRLLRERGETPGSFLIREAVTEDVPALAVLHVQTWNETYGTPRFSKLGLRTRQWQEQFAAKDDSWCCYVVADPKGKLVGFAKVARYAHADLKDYHGQLDKIYLLKDYQRIGLGRKLAGYSARWLLERNISTMVLFGVPQNPTCYFHEALGGKKLINSKGGFDGGYGWKDISILAG